jgi:hypothetical protein
VCDWDDYLNTLKINGNLDAETHSRIYEFLENMYSCTTTILLHAPEDLTLEFVKDMAKWGEVAEDIKKTLLKEEEDAENEKCTCNGECGGCNRNGMVEEIQGENSEEVS